MAKITMEAARVNAGLTQAELAEKMGVTRPYVNAVENGRMELKSWYLLAFCQLTNMDTADILLPTESTKR